MEPAQPRGEGAARAGHHRRAPAEAQPRPARTGHRRRGPRRAPGARIGPPAHHRRPRLRNRRPGEALLRNPPLPNRRKHQLPGPHPPERTPRLPPPRHRRGPPAQQSGGPPPPGPRHHPRNPQGLDSVVTKPERDARSLPPGRSQSVPFVLRALCSAASAPRNVRPASVSTSTTIHRPR